MHTYIHPHTHTTHTQTQTTHTYTHTTQGVTAENAFQKTYKIVKFEGTVFPFELKLSCDYFQVLSLV